MSETDNESDLEIDLKYQESKLKGDIEIIQKEVELLLYLLDRREQELLNIQQQLYNVISELSSAKQST